MTKEDSRKGESDMKDSVMYPHDLLCDLANASRTLDYDIGIYENIGDEIREWRMIGQLDLCLELWLKL